MMVHVSPKPSPSDRETLAYDVVRLAKPRSTPRGFFLKLVKDARLEERDVRWRGRKPSKIN